MQESEKGSRALTVAKLGGFLLHGAQLSPAIAAGREAAGGEVPEQRLPHSLGPAQHAPSNKDRHRTADEERLLLLLEQLG
jgi:hypothetical protein